MAFAEVLLMSSSKIFLVGPTIYQNHLVAVVGLPKG